MAEQIASFIPVHIMYSSFTRKLMDDVLSAARSVGLPTDDAFEMDFDRFKRDNENLYKEMHDIAVEGFGDLTTKAELLTQGLCNMRNATAAGVAPPAQPWDIVGVQERVKRDAYCMLEPMIGNAEARTGRNAGVAGQTSTGSSTGGNAGVAAAKEAEGSSTAGPSTGTSTGENAGSGSPTSG